LRRGRGATCGFHSGAGFFFDAARGFFRGRAHHQRLAFAFLTLALGFITTVFFQHALARGEF